MCDIVSSQADESRYRKASKTPEFCVTTAIGYSKIAPVNTACPIAGKEAAWGNRVQRNPVIPPLLCMCACPVTITLNATVTASSIKRQCWYSTQRNTVLWWWRSMWTMVTAVWILLTLDSDIFNIHHMSAVMVGNLGRLLGINLPDKAVMDFDFPGIGFPV